MGHVCDHPPLQLDEGSHCVSCDKFIPKATSVVVLEGSISASGLYIEGWFSFHYPQCERLQLRFPLEGHKVLRNSIVFSDVHKLWERKVATVPLQRPPHIPLPQRTQTSSLFSLPTEIRLEIYSYILPSMHPVNKIVPLHKDSLRMICEDSLFRPRRRDLTKSNLLLSCKAIHSEALDLLFRSTTYKFLNTKDMYLFLRHIGHAGRQLVRSVQVLCGSREDAPAFALLACCEKLRSINIDLPRSKLVWKGAPLWLTDGVACMLALDGLEKVECFMTNMHTTWQRSGQVPIFASAAYVKEQLSRKKGTASDVMEFEDLSAIGSLD